MTTTPARQSIGIKLVAIFFGFGACMCALTISLLIFSVGPMDMLWRLNPDARVGFQRIGPGLSIAIMAIVGTACALAALGLANGRLWARPLALIILAANLIGDVTSAVVRHDPRTLIGLPIAAALIWYLAQQNGGVPEINDQ